MAKFRELLDSKNINGGLVIDGLVTPEKFVWDRKHFVLTTYGGIVWQRYL